MQRIRETEENDFYFEFFKRIERNKKSVFLLGDTQEKIDSLKAELAEDYPKPVSYTHLDVYKRQQLHSAGSDYVCGTLFEQ